MTIKLKATRFHIRRQAPVAPPPPASEGLLFDTQEDGFGNQSFLPNQPAAGQPATATAMRVPRDEAEVAAAIAAIRAEGLTGRQLRLARRMAETQKINAKSEFDAVRLLRLAGIDPFQRATMLDLVLPGGEVPGGIGPTAASRTAADQTAAGPGVVDPAAGAASEPGRALTTLPGDGVRMGAN